MKKSKEIKSEVKYISYPNGTKYILKNRRVTVLDRENGDVVIKFDLLDETPEPTVIHEHVRGKIHRVGFALSPEAIDCLVHGLIERQKRLTTKPQ